MIINTTQNKRLFTATGSFTNCEDSRSEKIPAKPILTSSETFCREGYHPQTGPPPRPLSQCYWVIQNTSLFINCLPQAPLLTSICTNGHWNVSAIYCSVTWYSFLQQTSVPALYTTILKILSTENPITVFTHFFTSVLKSPDSKELSRYLDV